VGLGSAFYADQVVLVDHEEVIQAARRRRVGTALLGEALGEARRRGCRWAVLEPTPESAAFYDALGFEVEACRPDLELHLPLETAGATDEGDEQVDLIDEQDRVIGRAGRRQVRRANLLHRGVGVVCRNSAGQIYVHRRTDSKDVFPGMYDASVGGVVASGERYQDAARRELAEELGIVGPEPSFLFMHRYRGAQVDTWNAVFEVVWDGPIVHQPEEIAWGAFLTEEELRWRLETGTWTFVPDGLELLRRYLASA
jgi:isopentenyldiphosphate isomerase